MNTRRAIVGFCCLIIYLFATPFAFGQGARTALKDKQITIKMENQPLGVVFRYLMENYDIPIGFEQSVLDRGHSDYAFQTNLPSSAQHVMKSADSNIQLDIRAQRAFDARTHPITVNIKDGSVEEVFTQIVKQMENYKWEINDDVVNIYPANGRDKRFEELMGTSVKWFTLEKDKKIYDITTNIMLLPEFRNFIRKYKFRFTGVRVGTTFLVDAQYGRVLDVGMDFSDLTFRDLLNRIIKVKRGGWILKWRRATADGEEFIDLDI